MDSAPLHGEILAVPERVIVAPAVGVFRPPGRDPDGERDVIAAGQAIGVVEGPGASTPVRSPFRGSLMGCWPAPASGSARASPSPGCAWT